MAGPRTPEDPHDETAADGGSADDSNPETVVEDAASDGPEEPIEAEFEPAESPMRRVAGMQVTMPVAVALAAGAAVLGGVFGVVFDGGGGAQSSRMSAEVDARMSGYEDRLRTLRQAIMESGGEGGELAAGALADIEAELAAVRDDVAETASRLSVIESANGNSEAAAALAGRLDEIAEQAEGARRLAEEAMAEPNAQAAEIETLATRVNTLSDTVRAQGRAIEQLSDSTSVLAGRVTGVSAPTRLATAGAAAAISFAGLQDAALSGRPFATEYATAAEYFGDHPDMVALGDYADSGAPTPVALAASFRTAANAARDAERPTGGGFIDRLARGVTGLVTVRRLDAPATDSAADVVVRAQRRLTQDDLAGAVAEMERLEGPSAEAVEVWVDEARARVEIETHLDAIRQSFSES